MSYSEDIFTGGTASADASYPGGANNPSNVVDGNLGNSWLTPDGDDHPHWWKYDLGAGVTKTVAKIRILTESGRVKDFTFQGSNNDSDWTTLLTDQAANTTAWQDFTFDNSTAYRYYRIYMTNNWAGNVYSMIKEAEAMEFWPDISVSESISISEGAFTGATSLKLSYQMDKSESITISESVKELVTSFIDSNETVTVSENKDTTVRDGYQISIWWEEITVTDIPLFPGPFNSGFHEENVTISEKVVVKITNPSNYGHKPSFEVDN